MESIRPLVIVKDTLKNNPTDSMIDFYKTSWNQSKNFRTKTVVITLQFPCYAYAKYMQI